MYKKYVRMPKTGAFFALRGGMCYDWETGTPYTVSDRGWPVPAAYSLYSGLQCTLL
jgi:hypothetical protein